MCFAWQGITSETVSDDQEQQRRGAVGGEATATLAGALEKPRVKGEALKDQGFQKKKEGKPLSRDDLCCRRRRGGRAACFHSRLYVMLC